MCLLSGVNTLDSFLFVFQVKDVIDNLCVRHGDITKLPWSDLLWLIRKTT